MLYHFNIEIMPKIKSTYTVARNTVWQVADPYNILLCVKEGRCHIETSGEKHLLEKESCIFIPANQPYKRTPIDNELCEMMYVHFTAGETEELTEQEASAMINSRKAEAEQALLDSQNSLVAALTDIFLKPVLHRDDGKLLAICEKIKALRYGYKTDNTLFLLVYFCEMLTKLCADSDIPCFFWDNGEEFDRKSFEWRTQGLIEALNRAVSDEDYVPVKQS